MLKLTALVLLFTLTACKRQDDGAAELTAEDNGDGGVATWNGEDWRAEIQLPDVVLPVGLHIAASGDAAWFSNGIERVEVGEVQIEGPRYRLHFPVFNNTFDLLREGDRLEGTLTLVKRGYQQHLPVVATPDPGYRFMPDPQPEVDVTGRWEVLFVDEEGNEGSAIGEFDQQGSTLTGTFLTPTGDYRYLAGEVDGRRMMLSTFDGAHAFVFTATMDAFGSLSGDFWSGSHWHETWTARRNFDVELPDAYSLTYLNPGYDTVEFTFPDLEGQPLSLSDPKFQDKVVLVNISGTWCPNCADEADFLARYYLENRHRGLEVITLLFEHVRDFSQAAAQGRELVEKHGIEYDVLV
ncbi:MAG: TlpA disulfide reductase family protein, partial [Xanthomonadales bacterium]|nr:TlpA disulfide reductase family protein [Xanthomonadales bacterium]